VSRGHSLEATLLKSYCRVPQGEDDIERRPPYQEGNMTAPRISPQGVILLKTSSSGGSPDHPEAISSRRHSIEDLLVRRIT